MTAGQPEDHHSREMIEWWQTLLISWGSSFIVGALAVAIHVRTARENWASEERRAQRKVEDEQRQTIQRIRRERVQPIVDFVKLAKQYFAQEAIERVVDRLYDRSAKDSMSAGQFREKLKTIFPEYSGESDDLVRFKAFAVASGAASTHGMLDKVMRVNDAMAQQPPTLKGMDAIMDAERLIEQYLAGIIQPDETPTEAKE